MKGKQLVGLSSPTRGRFSGFMLMSLVAFLSACDGGTTDAENVNDGANQSVPVELPPSIKKTSTYRCKDNSVVSVDFLDDDRSANLRTDGGIAQLKATEAGGPLQGDGVILTVEESGITLTVSGKKPRHCKT